MDRSWLTGSWEQYTRPAMNGKDGKVNVKVERPSDAAEEFETDLVSTA
jgi:hypothetical protein